MEPITEKVVEEEKIETATQIPTEEVVEEKEKIENQSTEPDLPLTPPCPSLEDAAELSGRPGRSGDVLSARADQEARGIYPRQDQRSARHVRFAQR